jgi:prepilin-type N-terminal cleavage/methylation domain-containing protein
MLDTTARAPSSGPSLAESGFTLLELIMGTTVLAIGICGLAVSLVYSMTLAQTNRESAEARIAAKEILERVRGVPVEEIFAAFNGTADDDGTTTAGAPGSTFQLTRTTKDGATATYTAHVEFPVGDMAGVLREDLEDELLGMPRDLNGDGLIDSENHAADYLIIPIRIRVIWRGKTGPREFELCTVLRRS